MPYYEVHCPCGKVTRKYASPKQYKPKYCNRECTNRYHYGSLKPRKYHFTPEMDRRIRDIYLNEVGIKATAYAGPVKALAQKFGMPRWAISNRARALGILPLQKKEPNWSKKEIGFLERNAHLTPVVLQKNLKRIGSHRTIQGITLKRKRLHLSRSSMDGYTAGSLAECFGIDVHSITRWIGKGWLKARKRGTARTPQQGGDEWYITDPWVRDFIIHYLAVIDIRKVDKYWLVDLLAGGYYGLESLERKEVPEKPTCMAAGRDIDSLEATDEDYAPVCEEVLEIFEEAQARHNYGGQGMI